MKIRKRIFGGCIPASVTPLVVFMLTFYTGAAAETPDTMSSTGWTKQQLLFAMEQMRKKYHDCTGKRIPSDSLFYLSPFGNVMSLYGTSYGGLIGRDSINDIFRTLSRRYLPDTTLIADMERNGEMFFRYEKKRRCYAAVSEGLIGTGGLLVFGALFMLFAEVGEKTPERLAVAGLATASCGVIVAPFVFVYMIRGIPYIRRTVQDGREIIARSNALQLRKRCGITE